MVVLFVVVPDVEVAVVAMVVTFVVDVVVAVVVVSTAVVVALVLVLWKELSSSTFATVLVSSLEDVSGNAKVGVIDINKNVFAMQTIRGNRWRATTTHCFCGSFSTPLSVFRAVPSARSSVFRTIGPIHLTFPPIIGKEYMRRFNFVLFHFHNNEPGSGSFSQRPSMIITHYVIFVKTFYYTLLKVYYIK